MEYSAPVSFLVRRRRQLFHWDSWIVALVAFIPLLSTQRGLLADDTKVYLYFDPGHLLSTASSLWNADIGFGTVTHQNIGYLFPMGPYYWLAKNLGVSMWIAQRFWMGSLLLLAALGVRRCAQELGLSRWAGWAAAIPYMLSPFILVNLDRTSAILMPWAGLGWMMVFIIRAARRNDWRNPALFAIVVALTGGVNATSILMIGFAPLFYLLYAGWFGEIPWRRCFTVIARVSLLSLMVSLWWLAGLWAEGKYGLDILKFTESFATVTTTSTSPEVFRGLGYWYFYGLDGLQNWTLTSLSYMRGPLIPMASFVAPVAGFVAALCVRWRYRMFAVVTAFAGVVIAVGAYPLSRPTPIGLVLKWIALHTTVGLAMRSTNRVLPIMILGLGLVTAAAFDAIRRSNARVAWTGFATLMAFVAVAMAPLFQGKIISTNLTLPQTLPNYMTKAADRLNATDSTSGVLGLPGLDFAYYRFGTFNDSIWPALIHRPWVSSQVQLAGLPASINLARGLDSPLQDGIAEPTSIAPIARLFGTSAVLLQMNGQYERYATPQPTYLWNLFQPMPPGLKLVGTFGPRTNFQVSNGPFIDEAVLGLPPGYRWPRSLAILHVDGVRPLVRTEESTTPQIVAGDGEGLVTLGTVGLLDHQRPIFFDAALSRKAVALLAQKSGAWLVLTDSNQRRLDTFGTLNSTQGYVEQIHETPVVVDLKEQSIPVFPHEPESAQTVALMTGLSSVSASQYGNVIANNPEDQPFEAVDGKLNTAWEVGAFNSAIGEFIQMSAQKPVLIQSIHLVQPQSLTQNRRITKIGISIDGGRQIVRYLAFVSTTPAGQTITIPPTTGRTIRLTILDDSDHDRLKTVASGVGFAEVSIPGFGPATRGLLLPTSLLTSAGLRAAVDHLTIVANRLRVATVPPRLDPELSLLRYFDLPYSRKFKISGFANVNAAAGDDLLNSILHRRAGSGTSVIAAQSSSQLGGSLNSYGWDAFDHNSATAWQSGFRRPLGEWIQATVNHRSTVANFNLTIINDGYHSVPTEMSVSNGTTTENFSVPAVLAAQGSSLGTQQVFSIHVSPLVGTTFRFTIVKAAIATVLDRVSGGVNFPAFGIVDVVIPGIGAGVTPTNFDSGCRSDLLAIDGAPISVRVTGSTADALAQRRLSVTPCRATTITLSSGRHVMTSALGYLTGLNVNTLVLDSPSATTTIEPTFTSINAHWYGRSVIHSSVSPAQSGQWVVLGQSYAAGWHATLAGRDLGSPTLIDGASMGWLLPSKIAQTESLNFEWQPQRTVFLALLLSSLALLLVLFMAVTNRPRGRRRVVSPQNASAVPEPQFQVRQMHVESGRTFHYVVALVAGLSVSFYAVPVTLLAVFVWRRRDRLGLGLALLAVVFIGTGAAVTTRSSMVPWLRDISWPAHVNYANSVVWMALALWLIVVAGTSLRGHHSVSSAPSVISNAPTVEATPPTQNVESTAFAVSTHVRTSLPAPSETFLAPNSRRRGLNIPDLPQPPMEEHEPQEIEVIPTSGLRRTLFLIRGVWRNRHSPEEWRTVLTQDSINQVIGKTPIFNRTVLDISDTPASYTHGLVERGAHVTTMQFKVPMAQRSNAPTPPIDAIVNAEEFSQAHIPANSNQFDLVFATNIFSCVGDPMTLLNEVARVTRSGGTIYIQNVMWNSFLGGRETSPWHLLSGNYARRRYIRKHGHEPFHRFGINYFKLRPHQLISILKSRPDLSVFIAGPRFLPSKWGWILRVPFLRGLVVQDMIVVVERR